MTYVGAVDLLIGIGAAWLVYEEQLAPFHPPYKAWVVIGTAAVAVLFLGAGALMLAGRMLGARIGEVAGAIGVAFGFLMVFEGFGSGGMYGGVAVVLGLIVMALCGGLWLANHSLVRPARRRVTPGR